MIDKCLEALEEVRTIVKNGEANQRPGDVLAKLDEAEHVYHELKSDLWDTKMVLGRQLKK